MPLLFDQTSVFRAGSQDWQPVCQENVPMKYSICSSQRICWQRCFAWITFTFLMRKHMLPPRQDGSDLSCCACCRITNRILRCQCGTKTPRLLWFLPSRLHWTSSWRHLFVLLLKEWFPTVLSLKKILHHWGRTDKTGYKLNDCIVSGDAWVRQRWKSIWGEDVIIRAFCQKLSVLLAHWFSAPLCSPLRIFPCRYSHSRHHLVIDLHFSVAHPKSCTMLQSTRGYHWFVK